jgi:hypothetical protein
LSWKRAALATRRIRALLAAAIVARAEILALGTVAARRAIVAVALAGIGLAAARIGLLLVGLLFVRLLFVRLAALGPGGIGALLALGAAGKTALGEFLLGAPGRAGAALAAGGPVTPAAGIVVFVVVAGHERSRFG